MLYEKLYAQLDQLVGGIDAFVSNYGNTLKLRVPGYMDLSIESLGDNTLSMTHYYEQNGDVHF